MEKFIQWVTSKFQSPLSLLFFLFGVVLVLLGVTTGLEVPFLKQLAPDGNYRPVSITAGAVFFAVAILIYYFPPKSKEEPKGARPSPAIPEELTRSFASRISGLSQKQKSILALIEQESVRGGITTEDAIRNAFRECNDREVYYRLEQLRLLGFVIIQKLDKNRLAYRLTDDYQKEVGGVTRPSYGLPHS